MRQTLSALTAACLLALSQAAWSSSGDGELRQRARTAALALPDIDRTYGALLLQEALQAQPSVPTARRSLPLARVAAAANQALQQHYASCAGHHLPPAGLVQFHWLKPAPQDLHARPRMDLDEPMVQRWTQKLMALHA